jgi:hypothetical protein
MRAKPIRPSSFIAAKRLDAALVSETPSSENTCGNPRYRTKANELHVDVVMLRNTREPCGGYPAGVTGWELGYGYSYTNDGYWTQTTAIGHKRRLLDEPKSSRVIPQAVGKGKLTRPLIGNETNWIPYYIFAAIAEVVLITLGIACGNGEKSQQHVYTNSDWHRCTLIGFSGQAPQTSASFEIWFDHLTASYLIEN